ncbi:DUF59 domain-containing protein [candidate division WOR-3 bacterium]|jgi:metal-sulfur cluster biosynthetic enzyme|nr:DUF59 domain-containing protein [candidate division WOR-3 bacterium]
MSLRSEVIGKLKNIIDPGVRKNIWDLHLLYDIEIDEDKRDIELKFKPTVKHCPIGIQLAIMIKTKLMEIDNVGKINIKVTDFIHAEEANKILNKMK